MPVPPFIVIVAELAPLPKHMPVVVIATGRPEDEVAATGNELPNVAFDGGGVVTVIVWFAFVALVLLVTCVAGL
jgi:hypothetical protein